MLLLVRCMVSVGSARDEHTTMEAFMKTTGKYAIAILSLVALIAVSIHAFAAEGGSSRSGSGDPFTSIFHLASSPSLAIGNRPTVFTEPVVIHSGKDASRRVRTVRSRRAAALHSSPSPLGGRPPSFRERMERAHSIVCRPRTMLGCSLLFLPS